MRTSGTTELISRPKNFKTAYCERFGHAPEKFEQKLFWDAMDSDAKAVAFIIKCLRPRFFQTDFECIRKVAAANTTDEIRGIVNALQFGRNINDGFIRGFWRVRVSGERLMSIAATVMDSKSSDVEVAL